MSDVGQALAVLQFGDSFFPSGAVSFSWGLEGLSDNGVVTDADAVRAFVIGQLRAAGLKQHLVGQLDDHAAAAEGHLEPAAVDVAQEIGQAPFALSSIERDAEIDRFLQIWRQFGQHRNAPARMESANHNWNIDRSGPGALRQQAVHARETV